jgi:hypothetical protein
MKEYPKVRIPKIIPPKTILKLVHADSTTPLWKNQIGRRYRVGYYSKQDGKNTIWLVDEAGNYCETTDRKTLMSYFEIVRLAKKTDLFGENARPLGPIKNLPGESEFGRGAKGKKK